MADRKNIWNKPVKKEDDKKDKEEKEGDLRVDIESRPG